jgi:uncharacterized protein (DUF952 family)
MLSLPAFECLLPSRVNPLGIKSGQERGVQPIVLPYFSSGTGFNLDGARPWRHVIPMLIYKIFRAREWQEFQNSGETLGAPVDLVDGYIHFSTATQARVTAAKHFAGEDMLILLALDSETLADIRWEPSRGGDLFAHMYGQLALSDVLWSRPLPLTPTGHDFPEGFK